MYCSILLVTGILYIVIINVRHLVCCQKPHIMKNMLYDANLYL